MKQLPYYTQFVSEDTAEARRALGEYLQPCAAKGWRVEASDAAEPHAEPQEGVVYHVGLDDLSAPPAGVTAELHEVEVETRP